MDIQTKEAYFIDGFGELQKAIIKINWNLNIMIDVFNKNNKKTSYAHLFFHPNNRIYLDVIYCLDKFRRRGIATKVMQLIDYLLKSFENYVIRGSYEPRQLASDRQSNVFREALELDLGARKFYAKCGYEILNFEEFVANPGQHGFLAEEDDFQLGESTSEYIVTKQIKKQKQYYFYEEDGVIKETSMELVGKSK